MIQLTIIEDFEIQNFYLRNCSNKAEIFYTGNNFFFIFSLSTNPHFFIFFCPANAKKCLKYRKRSKTEHVCECKTNTVLNLQKNKFVSLFYDDKIIMDHFRFASHFVSQSCFFKSHVIILSYKLTGTIKH